MGVSPGEHGGRQVCTALSQRVNDTMTSGSAGQLALRIGLSDSAAFDNFYRAANAEAADAMCRAAEGEVKLVYLYGAAGTGKTHLLYAALKHARSLGRAALYVPLAGAQFGESVLDAVNGDGLVCLDDVHAARGKAMEAAVFRLFERVREQGGTLAATADCEPTRLGFELRDLTSRLRSALVYRLLPLSDVDKGAALKLRARARGLVIADDVVRYVMNRYPRDTHALFGLLDRVDRASMAAQRRITIPFLQELEKAG